MADTDTDVPNASKLTHPLVIILEIAFYFAVGMLIHHFFFGTLDWNDPITYAVILGWPALVLWKFLYILAWIAGILIIILALALFFEWVNS